MHRSGWQQLKEKKRRITGRSPVCICIFHSICSGDPVYGGTPHFP